MYFHDMRYAVRKLSETPVFTFLVIIILALGIGANAAVFSVMNAILFRLLPVSRAEGLSYVRIGEGRGPAPGATSTGDPNASFPLTAFEALRQRNDIFEQLIAYAPLSLTGSVSVRHGRVPEQAEGDEVSGNFFSGLGARIELGRGFTLDDERNHALIAVLSYAFWTRSYARDSSILGQTLYVKGIPLTVVGVGAPHFKGVEAGQATDFWIPLQDRPELNAWGAPAAAKTLYGTPNWWCLYMMSRLRPDISSIKAEQALMGTFGEAVRESVGTVNPNVWKPQLGFTPARGIGGYGQYYRQPLRILVGLVTLVLLLACTNVAMMIQARNATRESEFSLRLALGASRGIIFRQLLSESLLLVIAGTMLGWLFAIVSTRMLSTWAGIETGLTPNFSTLLFTLAVSSGATLVFGFIPLWKAIHSPVIGVLRSTAASVTTSRSRIVGGYAVQAGQIAVCLVLLMAAMLLLRTLRNFATTNLGMEAQNVLVFGVTPPRQTDTHVFYLSLLDRIRQTPGIESVSMAENRPGSGWSDDNSGFRIDGGGVHSESLRSNGVGSAFFHTMGIPLIAGRDIADSDSQATRLVAVVNMTFAQKYFPNVNPLGHVLSWGPAQLTIVGVARDSKYAAVDEEPMPMAYFAQMQRRSLGSMQIEVRPSGATMAILPELRKVIAAFDPNVPLEEPMTQQAQFEKSYEQQRMFAAMGGFFGVLAALLVATGLYGSHSLRVNQRGKEIGVRMAVGASRAKVLGMVLCESLWILVCGLIAGVPLTLLAVRPLKSMLYQLSPLDPLSFALSTMTIIAVSAGAALVPAWRAASIDPIRSLRAE